MENVEKGVFRQVSLRIRPDVWRVVRDYCRASGKSQREVVETALLWYIAAEVRVAREQVKTRVFPPAAAGIAQVKVPGVDV